MPTSKEKRAAANEAAFHTRKKIKFEKQIRKKISKFFKRQNLNVKKSLGRGNSYSANADLDELQNIL